jgi:hypothetical protein
MSDKITGYLEIGLDEETLEVVISFPATDDDTAHHVIFSADQARTLARKLIHHADDSDLLRGRSRN